MTPLKSKEVADKITKPSKLFPSYLGKAIDGGRPAFNAAASLKNAYHIFRSSTNLEEHIKKAAARMNCETSAGEGTYT